MSESEGDIVQHLLAVDCLGESFHGEDFISDLTVRAEVDIRILSAGRLDLIELDLFQGALSGSRLFGF